MAKKSSSNALFWAKHLGLALALIIIAAVVITLQRTNLDTPVPEGAVETKKSVSSGLTDFYSTHRMSSSKPFQDDIGDFVMELNEPEESLNDRLRSMESLQKPLSDSWVGEYKHRSFKAGSTIREAITGFAQSEGLQVIWELNKDFVVKHHFQMDSTVTGSMGKIASAINSSFEGEVRAYLCPKQRSLVITEKTTPYLLQNCSRINS